MTTKKNKIKFGKNIFEEREEAIDQIDFNQIIFLQLNRINLISSIINQNGAYKNINELLTFRRAVLTLHYLIKGFHTEKYAKEINKIKNEIYSIQHKLKNSRDNIRYEQLLDELYEKVMLFVYNCNILVTVKRQFID